ncbi:MAG TPA: hypothetical protein EYG50_05845 [Cycloclasticus sp.]|jgi:tetratricopeptide (TPR) repeat protein|nr:hypothetical protein [Cycloclasticus sp.]
MFNKKFIWVLLLVLPVTVLANPAIKDLQTGWAKANYQLKGDDQEKSFEMLIVQADNALQMEPTSAELLIWRGIIKSSYAGVAGGLGALSLIKEAKDDLEKAIQIDDVALSGSAYTSLGTLYFKAPGWPISFGDDEKAKELLEKAIFEDQKGIDSNYFYAEFLKEQGDYALAKTHLLRAQYAPKRRGRAIADNGRQDDITQMLREVKDALN